MVALGQDALAGAVRPHDADEEASAELLGKGDVVAPRRPDRRRDAGLVAAGRLHRLYLSLIHI